MRYTGTLEGFFETGCEGMMWTLIQDNMKGYEAILFLKEGDHLVVFGDNEIILFDGKIKTNREIGWAEYPLNPGHGQPTALGYWIHWTQEGWQPDDWARLFFHNPALKAELNRDK